MDAVVMGEESQSGQAAVESALTLPLTVFLILGTLQLFLMLQGRIMAEYAAFRAVRAGSVRHGDCEAMTHAAILAVMPSFHSFMGGKGGGSPGRKLALAFAERKHNRFVRRLDGGHDGTIVWIAREQPLASSVMDPEDLFFDQPDKPPMRLEARLVFWVPLTIPFANQVISRMMVARWGWKTYAAGNPLMPTQRARWKQEGTSHLESFIRAEMLARLARRQYTIPLNASASLRMMTPARARYFRTQNCPPAPEAL